MEKTSRSPVERPRVEITRFVSNKGSQQSLEEVSGGRLEPVYAYRATLKKIKANTFHFSCFGLFIIGFTSNPLLINTEPIFTRVLASVLPNHRRLCNRLC